MNRMRQRGVALVITLVMLAVVTFMAITFLAVSRRQRTSVSVSDEQTSARFMAEAASARAQRELVVRSFTRGNLTATELLVSTNFVNPWGFDDTIRTYNEANVGDEPRFLPARWDKWWLQNLSNLRLDPRAPVFVRTNSTSPNTEARHYLDLNRNGIFDPNGWLPEVVRNNPNDYRLLRTNGALDTVSLQPFQLQSRRYPNGMYLSNFYVGDPEWIGVLQHPEYPHSATNRFVGRYAFLVMPAGKSLDWNYLHNHAGSPLDERMVEPRFSRNQGVGSWELNLAAFLRDLNTNWYGLGSYRYTNTALSLGPTESGAAFYDAMRVLKYRYDGAYTRTKLASADRYFTNGARVFPNDDLDGYSDGPLQVLPANNYDEQNNRPDDALNRPWAGSRNPNAIEGFDRLFDTNLVGQRFVSALVQSNYSSYDRYTFYRLLGQIGTESAPADNYWRMQTTPQDLERYIRVQGRDFLNSWLTNREKINLNYNNVGRYVNGNWVPLTSTNLHAWDATNFFLIVGHQLLRSQLSAITDRTNLALVTNFFTLGGNLVRTNLDIDNIVVWRELTNASVTLHDVTNRFGLLPPTSEYSPTLHRLLQLTANLWDATTNRDPARPFIPTVFRPLYGAQPTSGRPTNIFIRGYAEVTNVSILKQVAPLDLRRPTDREALRDQVINNPNAVVVVYDVPFVIGAKKGLPNFNEVWIQNVAQAARKIELRKNRASDLGPSHTNLMYLLSISNTFGVEAWNSYSRRFDRELDLHVSGDFIENLAVPNADGTAGRSYYAATSTFTTNISFKSWPANAFSRPVYQAIRFLPNSVFNPAIANHTLGIPFTAETTNEFFVPNQGFYIPNWKLFVTNRIYYTLTDRQTGRLLDFVALGGMGAELAITQELPGRPQVVGGTTGNDTTTELPNMWLTNRVTAGGTNVPTQGVLNQIWLSLGQPRVASEATWRNWNLGWTQGRNKDKSIDLLRVFCGLTPLTATNQLERLQREAAANLAHQTGYTPTRKIYQNCSWQVNDPLVHYHLQDLLDPFNRPGDPMSTNQIRFASSMTVSLTNSNLGLTNNRYIPWGGNFYSTTTNNVTNSYVKDPLIWGSDDWDFPTNKFPNVGWIGRVHRGTPWQTVYLKSGMGNPTNWYRWSGSWGTHPTNDWSLVDLFTTTFNDNGVRGLISVNQTNLAAWSAVLSGVPVLTNLSARSAALVRTNGHGAYASILIQPAADAPQLLEIVEGINRTRNEFGGAFSRLGGILATPELTRRSPYLNPNNVMTDAVLERIPQQILSLVRGDEPRFVVYSFGQTLREAPGSVYLGAGPYNQLCTNYQVRAEYATRTVLRLEGSLNEPRFVVESFSELKGD